MELPPGFRFHPTDEELITHYLSNKVTDATFNAVAIGEVDLNKCEPWDLPCRAKMGEKEWYFFCVRDRKYPTGLRTNRATECGYWKATGKDREIHRGQGKKSLLLVGMKKTLVFYRGRAPKGEKTNWVMHEYRLLEADYYSVSNLPNSATSKNEWVICRVFKKSDSAAAAEGKRSMLGMGSASYGDDDVDELGGNYNPLLLLPPLMDVANKLGSLPMAATETEPAAAHVTCFSIERAAAEQKQLEHSRVADYYFNTSSTPPFLSCASNSFFSDHVSPSPLYISKMNMQGSNFQHRSNTTGDSSFVKLLQSDMFGMDYSLSCKAEKETVMSNISQDTGLTTADINTDISSVLSKCNDTAKKSLEEVPYSSAAPAASSSLQLEECLWSY